MSGEPEEKKEMPSFEAEFANMIRYADLYVRQKIDLYIQDYLLDPLDFLLKEIIYLSVIASLLVVGTIALAIGVVLFVSSIIPLWAALIACGTIALIIAVILVLVMFSRTLVLKTPKSGEVK